MIPLLALIYVMNFIPYNYLIAAIVFTIAILTDFVDGRIARKRNLVTNFGKVLDPVADKLVVMISLLLLFADGIINLYVGVLTIFILIARDYLVTGLRQVSASEGKVISAGNLGKAKTAIQSISVIMFYLVAEVGIAEVVVLDVFAYITLSIAIILTVLSDSKYIYEGRELLKK
ncbi:MAG: CDP-diacylglycerol--glycerol-3-phosphate 3-phosphatidyltransferase [Candidatus Woesearchaeota archaeon]